MVNVCGGVTEGVAVQGAGGIGKEGEPRGGGIAAWRRGRKGGREGGRVSQ